MQRRLKMAIRARGTREIDHICRHGCGSDQGSLVWLKIFWMGLEIVLIM